MKEETGFSGNARLLGEIYPQPAYSSQYAFIVLIELDNTISLKVPDEDENTEISFVNLIKISEKIKKGEIKDMGLISAISILNESER